MARSQGKNEILAVLAVSLQGKALKVETTFNASRLVFVYDANGLELADECKITKLSDATKLAQRANRMPELPVNASDAFSFIAWFADQGEKSAKRDIYRNAAKQFVTEVLKIAPEF